MKKRVPKSDDLRAYSEALKRYIAYAGIECYQKNRPLTEFRIQRLLKRYRILGTTAEKSWRLHGICALIGAGHP